MAILKLVLHPDPRLKMVCAPVETVDDEIRTLMDDMLETMYDAPGVGLAACQIGVLKRVLVMDCATAEEKASSDHSPVFMANPELTEVSEELNDYEEGCLSIPDHLGVVTRPARVKVKYLDRDNTQQERMFGGLWATCVQHEIDHLNGKLFIDHLSALKRDIITRKMIKYKQTLE